jgi:hypothetical protein
MKIEVNLPAYQLTWIEQAKSRIDRGQSVDEGTLAMIGDIFLESIEL